MLRARSDRPIKGIVCILIGTGMITMNDAMLKLVVTEHALGETIFVRGLFALAPTLFLIYRHGGWSSLRCHDVKGQVLCAVLLVLPVYLFIFSLRHLDLGLAIILVYAGPVMATALSAWLLREHVGLRRWCVVSVGFAGVVLVVQPASQAFSPIMLLPVLVACMVAAREIAIRRMVSAESTISIHFYSSLAVMLTALLTSFGQWVPLPLDVWAKLAVSGLGFGFGIFFLTDALRYADVSLLSPFKYTGVVWALGLGYLIWGERPTLLVLGGALIIVGSGLFLLKRNPPDATEPAAAPETARTGEHR